MTRINALARYIDILTDQGEASLCLGEDNTLEIAAGVYRDRIFKSEAITLSRADTVDFIAALQAWLDQLPSS